MMRLSLWMVLDSRVVPKRPGEKMRKWQGLGEGDGRQEEGGRETGDRREGGKVGQSKGVMCQAV